MPRPPALELDCQALTGARCRLEARGPLAWVIVHEIDHLEGVLCTGRPARVIPAGEP